jgi:uncharacterized membrane protein YvlD (DUF360 family)
VVAVAAVVVDVVVDAVELALVREILIAAVVLAAAKRLASKVVESLTGVRTARTTKPPRTLPPKKKALC